MTTNNSFPRLSALATTVAFLSMPAFAAAPAFDIQRIGLTGAGFTSQNGTAFSEVRHLNGSGLAVGYSSHYATGTNTVDGRAAWLYNGNSTVRVGLNGVGYTTQSGAEYSDVRFINSAGQVSGNSRIYSPSNNDSYGMATWIHGAGGTTRIGLTGAGYTSQNGTSFSTIDMMNDAGKVAGTSSRRSASDNSSRGEDAWLYNGSETVRIGLTGAAYTRADGYAISQTWTMNASGMVSGLTDRMGSPGGGQDAWLYDGTTTYKVGFSGEGYTNSRGSSYSHPNWLKNSGWLSGSSTRYAADSTDPRGQDAWLYRNGITTRVGLTGASYTGANGSADSSIHLLNEAGQASGSSARYSGNAAIAYDAWVHKNGVTQRIGLFGDGYTGSTGAAHSRAIVQNEVGDVAGYSHRYDPAGGNNQSRGQDTWLYKDGATQRIGLTGTGYTSENGTARSEIQKLNEAGHALGYSERFVDTDDNTRGQDAWLYNGSETVRIGLTGAGYTSQNGTATSFSRDRLNENGQVAGQSFRYSATSNTALGQSAWLFDLASNHTFDLTMDTRADGYAYSEATYLGEDGLVLGYYQSYDDATNALLGKRAFYFRKDKGLFDLGLLTSDLSLEGWSFLADVISANGIGHIVGTGRLAGLPNVTATYILTPTAVPVPAAAWLMGSGLLGLATLARRKSKQR